VADKSSLARGQTTNRATVVGLLSDHWGVLLVALGVVGAETVAALLEPWPIKVVLDTVLHAKALPSRLAQAVASTVGTTNASVPKSINPEQLTWEQAQELLAARRDAGPTPKRGGFKRRAAAGGGTKKKTARAGKAVEA